MATIRDVVEALARRGGVDAVVVVGRDGLPIDARAANGVDADNVAALLPSVINGLAQLGEAVDDRRQSAATLSARSEEHTSELQSRQYLVCRLLLEKKNRRRCRQLRVL